jgi:LysR family nitrogen assimilation transcriptional regulator
MDTRHLHTFATIAECGSFSEASRRLRIAQPALSRQIRALEASLPSPLFLRSGKGVTLTPAGERLFPYALSILRQLEAVPAIVSGSDADISGRVVIGLPTTASSVLSRPLLLAARSELPHVHLHLIESLSGYLAEWVQMGKLDLSVLYDPAPSSTLHLEGLLIEEVALVGAPHAFPAGVTQVRIEDLGRYPLILPGGPHSLRRQIDSVAIQHGAALDIPLEVDSLTIIKQMISEGPYFSILAQAAIHQELAERRLRSVPIVRPRISRSIALASSAVRGQTRACIAIARLTARLARALQQSGAWKSSPYMAPDARKDVI